MNLGVALWREGELDQAEQMLQASFRAALEVEPECCQPHYWLGRVYIDKLDFEKAVAHLQKGLACRDQETDRLSREALEQTFKVFAANQPFNAAAHADLATVLAMNELYSDADRAYARALEIEPDNADFVTNAGLSFLLQGRTDSAIGLFERAVEITNGADERVLAALQHAYQAQAENMANAA
eukprot:FR744035.1.p1 GENE.FR744035.1~~FR744035.1.p1  ORF type:complete len:183 (+),score=18.46 FR744035.1:35-583(+)